MYEHTKVWCLLIGMQFGAGCDGASAETPCQQNFNRELQCGIIYDDGIGICMEPEVECRFACMEDLSCEDLNAIYFGDDVLPTVVDQCRLDCARASGCRSETGCNHHARRPRWGELEKPELCIELCNKTGRLSCGVLEECIGSCEADHSQPGRCDSEIEEYWLCLLLTPDSEFDCDSGKIEPKDAVCGRATDNLDGCMLVPGS